MGAAAQVKKALGWEPKVPLREGLARMVDDFTKRCGATDLIIPGARASCNRLPAVCAARVACAPRSGLPAWATRCSFIYLKKGLRTRTMNV